MPELVFTQHNLGSIIEAHLGDKIELRLEENLTTGYSWEVDTKDTVVKLIESTYLNAPGTTMGRGGIRLIRFEAISLGSQEIYLKLRRPWEPPEKVLKHLDVTIRVW